MQYEIEIGGRRRQVVVIRAGDGFAVTVDGRTRQVDAARIDAHTLSLIVDTVRPDGDTAGGRSHELTVTADTRGSLIVQVDATPIPVTLDGGRRHTDAPAHAGDGPQHVTAPMPGKIVRVLVAAGDEVRLRQPLVVVEAMKMENELRAGRDGTAGAIHVDEGASVEAGALLIEIR